MGCVVWVEDTPNVIANQIQLDVNVMDSLSYVMKVMFSLSKKKKKKGIGPRTSPPFLLNLDSRNCSPGVETLLFDSILFLCL